MKELFTSLVKAQAQIKGALKENVNPHFKSRYADLESVVDAIREPLASNGLCFVQSVSDGHIHTIICHTSGEQMVSTVPFVGQMPDMQKLSSALTYARRQGLCTAFGVPQVDDDGESTAGRYQAPVAPAPKPVVSTPKTDRISADLAKELGTPAEVLVALKFSREDSKQVQAVKTALAKAKIPNETIKKHKEDFEAFLFDATYFSFDEAVFNFFSERK